VVCSGLCCLLSECFCGLCFVAVCDRCIKSRSFDDSVIVVCVGLVLLCCSLCVMCIEWRMSVLL